MTGEVPMTAQEERQRELPLLGSTFAVKDNLMESLACFPSRGPNTRC